MQSRPIGIIGDFDPENESHIATNEAIGHCANELDFHISYRWIGTEEITAENTRDHLSGFSGLWIAPASPYKSMEGALSAIRFGRENAVPVIGTCGGFQHIVLEFARNVLGISDGEHEETHPAASRLLISRLACSLVGRTLTIELLPESLVARLYGRTKVEERYHCNFGVNPDFVGTLCASSLKVVGRDSEGEVRAVELAGHPFFIGTLFIPQLSSSADAPHPLVFGFIKACLKSNDTDAALLSSEQLHNNP